MTDKATSEALRLAAWLNEGAWHQMRLGDVEAAGRELRRQHARISELQAELEAVGAGGVQALSAAPVGWKLVPVEPTQEMLEAPSNAWPADAKVTWTAMLAASPTPPAEQPAMESVLVDGIAYPTPAPVAGELLRLHLELRNATAEAAPVDQPGAVYAELPDCDATTFGLGQVWNRHSMRDFADRTHALRQAAAKAAPGEPNGVGDFLKDFTRHMSEQCDHTEKSFYRGLVKLTERAHKLLAAAITSHQPAGPKAAPQQEARGPVERYTIEDVRKARSDGYRNGVESSVPSKITKEMRHAFREKYKEGSIWTDRLDVALEGMLAAAPQPAAPQAAPAVDEQMRKDAERYRWLRDPGTSVAIVIARTNWVPPNDAVPGVGGYWGYEYHAGEELDAALDAALAAQGGA